MKKIYFIGIGGIGISALAQYYLAKGFGVYGSDLVSSEIIEMLEKKGAEIFINPSPNDLKIKKIIQEVDFLIYSRAIPKNHPELVLAKKFNIKSFSYPQALGKLTKKYFTIAVSGTHGKSTTSAMVSLILVRAKLNPTVILGTKLKEFGDSNFRMGEKLPKNIKLKIKNKKIENGILVIEADEWRASFLNYWPDILIITNIEREHLDYYKNLPSLIRAFKEFVGHLKEGGCLILNKDDQNIKKLKIKNPKFKIFKFGFQDKEAKKIKKILKIPGKHNIYNALAALTCARVMGISDDVIFEALANYKGSWRRMEEKKIYFKNREVILISDYGHHPTEIKATIKAIEEKYPKQKIWLIFQPHQYQRTFYLFDEFVEALGRLKIEKIIILPVFDVAGREEKAIQKKVSSEKLVQAINKKYKPQKTVFLPDFQKTKSFVEAYFQGDILVIMGAGNIYNLAKEFSP